MFFDSFFDQPRRFADPWEEQRRHMLAQRQREEAERRRQAELRMQREMLERERQRRAEQDALKRHMAAQQQQPEPAAAPRRTSPQPRRHDPFAFDPFFGRASGFPGFSDLWAGDDEPMHAQQPQQQPEHTQQPAQPEAPVEEPSPAPKAVRLPPTAGTGAAPKSVRRSHTVPQPPPNTAAEPPTAAPKRKPTAASRRPPMPAAVPVATMDLPTFPGTSTPPPAATSPTKDAPSPAASVPESQATSPMHSARSTAEDEEPPAGPEAAALQKIAEIVAAAEEIKKKFATAFTPIESEEQRAAVKKDRAFFEEGLLQQVLKLDGVETNGNQEVRKARKDAIVGIERSVAELKAFAQANDYDTKPAAAAADTPMKDDDDDSDSGVTMDE